MLSGVDPTPSGTNTGIDVAGIVDSVTQVQNAFDANVVDDEDDNGNNNNNGGGGGGGWKHSCSAHVQRVVPTGLSVAAKCFSCRVRADSLRYVGRRRAAVA